MTTLRARSSGNLLRFDRPIDRLAGETSPRCWKPPKPSSTATTPEPRRGHLEGFARLADMAPIFIALEPASAKGWYEQLGNQWLSDAVRRLRVCDANILPRSKRFRTCRRLWCLVLWLGSSATYSADGHARSWRPAGAPPVPRQRAACRPNQQRRVSIAGRLLSPQCSKALREHARQDLCAQVVRRLADPQDCYGAAPLGLSAKSARIAQDFGFSLLGGAWTRIEGNQRVADYELAFRAAGSVSSGRDGTALDFQSATRQACLCLCNGLDHGS